MGIHLDEFSEIAETAADRISIEDGRLKAASNWLGFAGIWWRMPSCRRTNRQVMQHFRKAMIDRFGFRTGSAAFHDLVDVRYQEQGKSISSSLIRRVIGRAEQLEQTRNADSLLASVSGKPILEWLEEIDRIPDKHTAACLRNTVANLGMTLEILSQSPANPSDVQTLRNLAETQLGVLNTHRQRLENEKWNTVSGIKTIRDELAGQIQQLEDKIAYIHELAVDRPLSFESVGNLIGLWKRAAISLIEADCSRLKKDPIRQALKNLADSILKETPEEIAEPGKLLRSYPRVLAKQITSRYRSLGLPCQSIPDRLEAAHVQALNTQIWPEIDRKIRIVHNHRPISFDSRILPAANLGNRFSELYPDRHGVSCHSITESSHAVNLCQSELTRSDSSEATPKVLFQGFRHGIHCAYGIRNPSEREEANRNRAKESILAVLIRNPNLLAQAIAGQTVRLPITSLSLVTPDDIRGFLKEFPGTDQQNNERRHLVEQTLAWSEFNGRPTELDVWDPDGIPRTVTVIPDIVTLNFGVNAGALRYNQISDFIGGWSHSNLLNKPGLEALVGNPDDPETVGGRAGQFLKTCQDTTTRKTIEDLVRQIKQVWKSGSYSRMGTDPYKMVARLAVLSCRVGDTFLWNCKSGKDRTGELDVEAKFLAARIDLNDGRVPIPDSPLTDSEKAMFREFALHSGNLEIQRLNTGLAGFKTEGVPAISERMGDMAARELHRGASRYIRG